MSLAPVPVCYSCCAAVAQVPIACTECNHLCCRACFGLMTEEGDSDVDPDGAELPLTKRAKIVRVCSKCRAGADKEAKERVSKLPAIKQEPVTEDLLSDVDETATSDKITSFKEEASPERLQRKQGGRCRKHDKDWKLYCLTCSELLCESCFWEEKSHVRHQIDFVEAVYRERRAKAEQKLEQLKEKALLLQQKATVESGKNLEIVQEVERSVCDEIDTLCAAAKQSVAKLTDGRKRKLQIRSDFPANAQKANATLQDMIEQLSPVDFLAQHWQLEKQCDELLGESVPVNLSRKRFDDIGCELVSPYKMRKLRLYNFETAVTWPRQLVTVCENKWFIELRKKDSLWVKVTPLAKEVLKFPFKLLVVVVHRELMQKTIRKTFTIQGTSEELEIASTHELISQGFIEESELVVKIGLRPASVVTENKLLKLQATALKKKLDFVFFLADPDDYLDSVLIDNQVYTIHYYDVYLYKQDNEESLLHSTKLSDHSGRKWCLQVHPLNRTDDGSTHLKAYIILCQGGPTRCRFFIELLNSDPTKNVQEIWENYFDAINEGYGWHRFIERRRLLRDPGFYPNGILRFRFGVLPTGA